MTAQRGEPVQCLTPDERTEIIEIIEAITKGSAIVCWTRCEPCQWGQHFDEPTWHSWAGPEDVDHAIATGQPDPSDRRCGCKCAEAER